MDEDWFRKRVVYTVPGMDEVEVLREIVYREVDGEGLPMDVYLPPRLRPDERRAGVVLIHGGPVPRMPGRSIKNLGVFLSYGELLAASGLVAVMFDHRFHAFADLAGSAANIAAAIAFAGQQAERFHLDADRLCLWAFSGGGSFLAPALRERPEHVRCLVAFYAALDLRPLAPRISDVPIEVLESYSPVACFTAEPFAGPPLLVARAGQDQPWLNATIDDFVRAALSANAPLDLLNHPSGRHGFDILDDHPRTHEILARTVEFVRTHTA
ncbi:MAG TPA: hypothetical protein VHQ90_14150 [Thermoanaerobaculia bacterium]|nr:hypothetical protein [Thermoanaerobaculia bacterium]